MSTTINALPLPDFLRRNVDEHITGEFTFESLVTAHLLELPGDWSNSVVVDSNTIDVSGVELHDGGSPNVAKWGTTAYGFGFGTGYAVEVMSIGFHESLEQEILALFGETNTALPMLQLLKFSGPDAAGPQILLNAELTRIGDFEFSVEAGGGFMTRREIELRDAGRIRSSYGLTTYGTLDIFHEGAVGWAALRLDAANGPMMLRDNGIIADENFLRFARTSTYSDTPSSNDGRVLFGTNGARFEGGGVNILGSTSTVAGIIESVVSSMFAVELAFLYDDGTGVGVGLKSVGYEFILSDNSGGIVTNAPANFQDEVQAKHFVFNTQATLTAASAGTQAGGTSITSDTAVITTVGGAGYSVTLPAISGQGRILVMNKGANSCNVFPPSGAKINALATNAAYALASGSSIEFIKATSTQFYTR